MGARKQFYALRGVKSARRGSARVKIVSESGSAQIADVTTTLESCDTMQREPLTLDYKQSFDCELL